MFSIMYYDSFLGKLCLVAQKKRLVGIYFAEQMPLNLFLSDKNIFSEDFPILQRTTEWLEQYFAQKKPNIESLEIELIGSQFQKQVWELLCTIPYGMVTTYQELSKIIARKRGQKRMSAQAIGGALAKNPFLILIPCHRVIGTNGSLTGYAGGLDRKEKLLVHEQADTRNLWRFANIEE